MRRFSQIPLPIQRDQEAQFLADGVTQVQQEVENSLLTVHDLDITNQPPPTPLDGMVRYADGVSWDPGFGEGLYYFEQGEWKKVLDAGTAAEVFTYAGYGGIQQSSPNVAGSNIGAAWQVLTSFDAATLITPVGVTQDVANNGLRFDHPGVWVLVVALAFEHNSSNSGRITYVRTYNATKDTGGSGVVIGTGRNAEATNFGASLLFELGVAEVGDLLQLQIGNGDSYTNVDWDALAFSTFHVGVYDVALGASSAPEPTYTRTPVRQVVFGDMSTFSESSDDQPNANWQAVTGGVVTVPASWDAGAVLVTASIFTACITVNPGTVNPPAGTCPEFAMDLGFSVNAGLVQNGLVFRGVQGIQWPDITTDEEGGIGGRVALSGILNVSPGDVIRLQGQKSPGVWQVGVSGDNGWLAYVNATGLFGKESVITIQPVEVV